VKFYSIILCLLSCFVTFCFTEANGQKPVTDQEVNPKIRPEIQNSGDDLVHIGDLIDVDIVGGFEFDWRGSLSADGFLDGLDSYGEPIYGLCRSEAQIAADVAKVLGKILRDPKVVVKILDRSNRAVVRLDGAVRTATRFRLKRTVNLRELLIIAGGLTDGASGEISIFRPKNVSCRPAIIPAAAGLPAPDNAPLITNIKISELLSGKAAANPEILSGDVITVERALPIYIIGAVNNPRPVYTREQMTLTRIIATAGGVTKDADGNKVSIFRRDGVDVRSIEADLGKVKRGETKDEVLLPFDIIEVASKGGGNRKYPPRLANDENRDRPSRELPLRIVE